MLDLGGSAERRGASAWPVHRWAVALDDGRLVFADTEDLTIDPGSYRSGPEPRIRPRGHPADTGESNRR
jgi:hypothetical protein